MEGVVGPGRDYPKQCRDSGLPCGSTIKRIYEKRRPLLGRYLPGGRLVIDNSIYGYCLHSSFELIQYCPVMGLSGSADHRFGLLLSQ